MVGIDLSRVQLDRNESLDEKIVGDIETYPLEAHSFDMIVCWNVLEHVPSPAAAIANLAQALRSGGLLVLACPNPRSLKGLVTRITPHSFHVWSYRHLRGSKRAGTKDYGPFPTVMHPDIAPAALSRLADELGLKTELQLCFSATRLSRSRALAVQTAELTVEAVALLLRLLTLGRYRGELSETRMILTRPR